MSTAMRRKKSMKTDLIVLSTHGRRGVKRLVMGNDAEQVVSTARVPVLLVRGNIVVDCSGKVIRAHLTAVKLTRRGTDILEWRMLKGVLSHSYDRWEGDRLWHWARSASASSS